MMGLVSFSEEQERPGFFLSLPCEDTARRLPSANEGAGPHQMLNLLAP